MIARTGLALSLALGLTLPLAAEPFQQAGEWREYHRDWLAACPDVIDEDATDYYGFSCFASTGSQELNSAGLPAYKLTLIRNRLTGEVDLAITVAADNVATDQTRPIIVAFGGEGAESLSFGTDLETRYNTANQFFVADPKRTEGFIEKMKERNSLRLTIPLTGPRRQVEVWLSLRGVLASMDFMSTYARRVAQY